MDEAWQLLVRDVHESPALTLLVLLPAAIGLVPLVLRGRLWALPFGVLLLQGAVWYGYHLMGSWSDVETYRPMATMLLVGPSAVSLVVAVYSSVASVRRVAGPRRLATPPPLRPAGTP